MNSDTHSLFAAIMAGGRGERFWLTGRRARPKQLLPLLGEKTMIEETVQRLFAGTRAGHHQSGLREADSGIAADFGRKCDWGPAGRDTAPCIALATALVARSNSEATMPFCRPIT